MRSVLNMCVSLLSLFLTVLNLLLCALEESLTVVTERDTQFECWMEDDRQTAERRVCELEFNDLNIHL